MKHTLKDLFANPNEVFEFTGQYGDVYKRDNECRDRLNHLLGCKLRSVFRDAKEVGSSAVSAKGVVDFDTGHMYLVNEKGAVLLVNNSEWASISLEKEPK